MVINLGQLQSDLSWKDRAISSEEITQSRLSYLRHLMNGSRFVEKSRRKSKLLQDLFMYLNKWKHFFLKVPYFSSTSLCLIVFLLCLNFCLLSYFEIIRCIVKSMIVNVFNWNTTEKRKHQKNFLMHQSLGT